MYTGFFELHHKPFELVPDPDFLYPSVTHKRAISYLDYAIRERLGFILLTGEVGSGKTTLIQTLLKSLDRSVSIARIFNTRVTFEQLLAMINDEFGLSTQGRDKVQLQRDLYEFLIQRFAAGSHAILIIDEAQNLTPELLEDLRMLSNLETGKAKLLQIILVGQPELKRVLGRPELRQLQQRISIACHLVPLSCEEVEQYIHHRLERAGKRDCVSFSAEALQRIHGHSRGIPRLINSMCDFLLLAAFVEQSREITAEMVEDVAQDMDIENRCWGYDEEQPSAPPPPAADAGAAGSPARSSQIDSIAMKEMLGYLNQRLDRMEKARTATPVAATPAEIGQRMDQLEQRLCDQSAQLQPALTELNRTLAALRTERQPRVEPPLQKSEPAVPEPQAQKRSWLKRLLG